MRQRERGCEEVKGEEERERGRERDNRAGGRKDETLSSLRD